MTCIGNRCTCENKWDKMAYTQEPFTSMGEMPLGGSWPLNFFKRTAEGRFTMLTGEPICFNIKTPDYFDKFWQEQLGAVMEASNTITPEQKVITTYWGAGVPDRQLIPILQTLVSSYKLQVPEAGRLYDLTMRALNDATVICWHFKYFYQVPRPVQYCQEFVPFLATPQHPSYPAGHSVMPACFCYLMAHFFPAEKDKLMQILEECSISRLYAGVHYPLDISEGNKLGEDIANKIIATLGTQCDATGATVERIHTEFRDAPIYPTNHQQVLN
ncbi:MAG: phosphatase PAP2 family protein [Cellulosilyticaceae bacterium]